MSLQTDASKPAVQNVVHRRIKPSSAVYWMRFVLAVAAGFANNLLHIGQANPSIGDPNLALILGIALGLGFYLLSILIVRRVLHYGEKDLKGKNRDVTLGGGTFIVVWVMVSVLLNTLGAGMG